MQNRGRLPSTRAGTSRSRRRLATLAGIVALTLGGFGTAGVFVVDAHSLGLTTTVVPQPPPTTAPAPDPAPSPPAPRHVSPPPPPAPVRVSPAPAPVTPPTPLPVVSPPVPPTTHPLAVAPKPHRRHRTVPKHAAPAPIPISRGAGGPARLDVGFVATPVSFQARYTSALPATSTGASQARLLLLAAIALGFVLVLASTLPGEALRPTFVYEVVAVHRIDLALVGFSIVVMVGALYLLTA
jgi:hypothetical protein